MSFVHARDRSKTLRSISSLANFMHARDAIPVAAISTAIHSAKQKREAPTVQTPHKATSGTLPHTPSGTLSRPRSSMEVEISLASFFSMSRRVMSSWLTTWVGTQELQ
eukprot:scaffold67718_cov15-Tisochrysis_lutea.AAC.1